jgi:heptaprenyl diphosphate synthase
MKRLELYAELKPDLASVEAELERCLRADHGLLGEAAAHLLKAGGKRVRPALVLIAGRFGRYSMERLMPVAVALELIHMGSLVHDDVIDDADIRRGMPTVKSRWDNKVAMYTGDYIFAKALSTIAELEHPDIHRILSRAMVQMCIGEMEQIRHFFEIGQSVRDYLLRIRRKTALLIAVSCQLGALAADAPRQVAARLYRYGYNIGMAFQIRDDILDITGTEERLGKPPGSDIRQGNITLPYIYALQDEAFRGRMLAMIRELRGGNGSGAAGELLALVRESGGVERAETLSARYIAKAREALDGLPDVPARGWLEGISQFLANRDH